MSSEQALGQMVRQAPWDLPAAAAGGGTCVLHLPRDSALTARATPALPQALRQAPPLHDVPMAGGRATPRPIRRCDRCMADLDRWPTYLLTTAVMTAVTAVSTAAATTTVTTTTAATTPVPPHGSPHETTVHP